MDSNKNHPSRLFLKLFLCCLTVVSVWQLGAFAQSNSEENKDHQQSGSPVSLAGVDAALSRPAGSTEPVVVPPISFVDVNSGRFGKLEIDLEDGQFLDTAVDKLHLIAQSLDVRAGTLESLNIAILGGHIHDFIFDKLNMSTSGN